MSAQFNKGNLFKSLHQSEGTFIIPNAWDACSAKLVEAAGYVALATSSAAFALTKGLNDNSVSLEKTLDNLYEIAEATSLPVSADFGCGFAEKPDDVYLNAKSLIRTGIVGASIEDVHDGKTYPLQLAKERVKAVCTAAKECAFPFTITARADNFFIGKNDFEDTLLRLQAFQEAGADVLFAPGINSLQHISSIINNTNKPLNFLFGLPNSSLTIQQLTQVDVKRISLGAALAKSAYTTIWDKLSTLKNNDTDIFKTSMTMNQLMQKIDVKILNS